MKTKKQIKKEIDDRLSALDFVNSEYSHLRESDIPVAVKIVNKTECEKIALLRWVLNG